MNFQDYGLLTMLIKGASKEQLDKIIRTLDEQQYARIEAIVANPAAVHELFLMMKDRAWFERLLVETFMEQAKQKEES